MDRLPVASPGWLEAAFRSGQIIDVILLLVVIEAVGLLLYRRSTGHGPRLADLGLTLLAGALLLLAVRAALTGAAAFAIAAPLTASFVVHLFDLKRRWPRD
jgi:hypothetical protein